MPLLPSRCSSFCNLLRTGRAAMCKPQNMPHIVHAAVNVGRGDVRTERCMHRLREHTGGGGAFRCVRIQQTIRRIAGRRGINVVLDHDAVDVARGQLTARRSGEAGHIRHKPVGLLVDKATRHAAERIVRAEAEYIRERGGIVCGAGRPAQRLEQPAAAGYAAQRQHGAAVTAAAHDTYAAAKLPARPTGRPKEPSR